MFPIIGIIVSLPIIAFGIFGFFYKKFADGQDGRAIGKITWVSEVNGDRDCSFKYTFEVDSVTFDGGGTEYGSDCLAVEASGTITVAYNTGNPADNSAEYDQKADFAVVVMLEIVGFGILIACIARLRYIHLNFDTTGDGIGDNRPATDEQMKTIENGMRELGQFYAIPKKRLSHEQAKQAISNINQQIASMRGRKKS